LATGEAGAEGGASVSRADDAYPISTASNASTASSTASGASTVIEGWLWPGPGACGGQQLMDAALSYPRGTETDC